MAAQSSPSLVICLKPMKPILTRLALTVPVVWLVVSLVFLLIHLVPGDPILQMLGEGATPADVGALRHQYHLDEPLPQQYLHYWEGCLLYTSLSLCGSREGIDLLTS